MPDAPGTPKSVTEYPVPAELSAANHKRIAIPKIEKDVRHMISLQNDKGRGATTCASDGRVSRIAQARLSGWTPNSRQLQGHLVFWFDER
jgi:hypothetical protein